MAQSLSRRDSDRSGRPSSEMRVLTRGKGSGGQRWIFVQEGSLREDCHIERKDREVRQVLICDIKPLLQ